MCIGGASPEAMYYLAAQKGRFFSLRMFLVLLIPLDKIRVYDHAAINEAIDLGWVAFGP